MAGNIRKVALGVKAKRERVKARALVGALKGNRVSAKTLVRYNRAILLFFEWLASKELGLPDDLVMLDALLSEYAEILWQEGESRSGLGDTLSGLTNYLKFLRGKLPDAWAQHSTWKKLELPARATPFTKNILMAAVGVALSQNDLAMAAGLWLGFQGLLRTGELLGLLKADIQVFEEQSLAVISLGFTEGGKRRGEKEQIIVSDAELVALLALLCENMRPGESLLPTEKFFRLRFGVILKELGLQKSGYMPYSLRRGGATSLFLETGDWQAVQARGRWQSIATAKIYVSECVAMVRELSLNVNQARQMNRWKKVMLGYFSK